MVLSTESPRYSSRSLLVTVCNLGSKADLWLKACLKMLRLRGVNPMMLATLLANCLSEERK